jgi:hypothetical protein
MDGITLVGPSRPLRRNSAAPVEPRHRSASLHALAALSRTDAVLGPRTNVTTKGCHYCQSGMYARPRYCPACGTIEHRDDERPMAPVEFHPSGPILSVR